jgi:hypothetical protein
MQHNTTNLLPWLQVARLGEDEPLLFMHEVYRAKIVWTVIFKGVIGEVR